MRGMVAAIERGQRAYGEFWHDLDRGRELPWHRRERRRKSCEQADPAALRDRLLDHRLIGFEHRLWRLLSRDRLDAGTEGRAGEQDSIGARACHVTSER